MTEEVLKAYPEAQVLQPVADHFAKLLSGLCVRPRADATAGCRAQSKALVQAMVLVIFLCFIDAGAILLYTKRLGGQFNEGPSFAARLVPLHSIILQSPDSPSSYSFLTWKAKLALPCPIRSIIRALPCVMAGRRSCG